MNRALFLLSTLLLFFSTTSLYGDEIADGEESANDPAFRGLAFSVGLFDLLEDEFETGEAGLEYRFKQVHLNKFWRWREIPFTPMVGVAFTAEDAFWVYAGLRYDWWIAKKWALTPSFAVSYYDEGSRGKDLGGEIQFRSGIEIGRQISQNSRVALHLNHLSHARIYDNINPGSESLLLVWSLGR